MRAARQATAGSVSIGLHPLLSTYLTAATLQRELVPGIDTCPFADPGEPLSSEDREPMTEAVLASGTLGLTLSPLILLVADLVDLSRLPLAAKRSASTGAQECSEAYGG